MLLLSPGPGVCHPFVQRREAMPIIHHRSEEFKAVYNSIVAQMKMIVQSKRCEIILQNGSGSTGMETSLMNLFQSHDKVIAINTGYFGERFASMARLQKLEVLECTYINEPYYIEDIETMFEEHEHIKGVLVTHSETSNGILNTLKPLGELCKKHGALLVVDSIGGIIMNPLHFDNDHIDCLIMASQKGFMMPPGLSMIALSVRAVKAVTDHKTASYAFSFENMIRKFHDDAKINTTPAISLYMALHEALCILNQHPISVWNRYYAALHEQLEAGLSKLEYPVCNQQNATNSLVLIRTKHQQKASLLQKLLEEHYDIRIELGLQDSSDKILRIGCMNYITEADINKLLDALKELETHL